jgi:GNS1/SUR4 family protein
MGFFDGVVATWPERSLFSFPPNPSPAFHPPPAPVSIANAPPFAIPDHVYQAVLDVKVPITIAAVYAVTVKFLNNYNRSTNKKPWALSRTRLFFAFVAAHNIFLAVYSAWTWWGMLGAASRSFVSPLGPDGLAGTIDSICRMNGAAGLGQAGFFNGDAQRWQSYGNALSTASDGALSFPPYSPKPTDTGRIWNEGLAFYGWIFYLSKFYEVLDTFIILAKGKLSSTLQTYHHAGAMMCMWAGMRYMSPPIWMFVFVNSGIHALMVGFPQGILA